VPPPAASSVPPPAAPSDAGTDADDESDETSKCS
jgi:hypothetical protein